MTNFLGDIRLLWAEQSLFWKSKVYLQMKHCSIGTTVDKAKRALVSMLLYLAAEFGLDLRLSRDSPDSVVSSSYRRVAREVHPDKGGSANTARELFAAKTAWDVAKKKSHKKARHQIFAATVAPHLAGGHHHLSAARSLW